jgi:branched-chain amino acid transport system substrate-binding protein
MDLETIRRFPRRRAGLSLAVLMAACALGLAACGGDDEAAAPPAPAEPAPAEPAPAEPAPAEPAPAETAMEETTPTETGGFTEGAVTDYLAYTGGTPGPADTSLPPVKIGWANNEGGQVLIGPTATQGAELAIKYANEQTGGIGGHPLELVKCAVKNTEEEGTTCGQQFLNDDGINVVAVGGLAVGAQSMEAVISPAKPIVASIAVGPGDSTNPNTYILGGTGTTVSWPWGTFFQQRGDKTAATVHPAGPGFDSPAQAHVEAIESVGGQIVDVGFDPASADVVGALQAAGVADVDMIIPNGDAGSCIKIAQALDQLGVDPNKVVSSPLCLAPQVAEGLGSDFPLWNYAAAQDIYMQPHPATQAYLAALTQYGEEINVTDPWYAAAFSQILTIVGWMNAIGYDNLSPETIAEQAQNWPGPLLIGQPNIQCGKYPSIPASCADQTIYFKYEGDGVFSDIYGWLYPPEPIQQEYDAQPPSG